MTKQSDVINDPNYIAVLDHGFVGLVDHMGSDGDIVSAARVSYGDGTKTVNEDRGLIRYLVSHRHTSPIEMAEVKLHLKMPIFVMRQWVRHRTASLNEYSGRYSIMSNEFYTPDVAALAPQSKDNKQGRDGSFTDVEAEGIQWMMDANYTHAYETYMALLTPGSEYPDEHTRRQVIYDAYSPGPARDEYDVEGFFDESYPGLSRELARINLPVANYTELYWKQNLHNLLHLIKLRRDAHAQREIRDYAEAVFTLIKPLFPLTVEAWEDYVWEGRHLSRMEAEILHELLQESAEPVYATPFEGFLRRVFTKPQTPLDRMITRAGGEKEFAKARGLSLRELRAFRKNWNI